ncbi:hypothetical protein D9613_002582 [Agrocybe pediades]|uniref:Uncharacterized protein n=1 Tax=Agrocybe pediades TaxID=84607 RepID=A0A8H4VNV0_9AGAR|nr:hypothetical protein D9613_002582 [Agrocybe pediades]
MTEYTTSPQAIYEYMNARERTARWVQQFTPYDQELYSPSVPPSVLEGMIPSSPPSEADSCHSTPPKMILRYNDGRPDIPIPQVPPSPRRYQRPSHSRSHTHSYDHVPNHAGSGSSRDTHQSYSRHREPDSAVPEEIRILPSYGAVPASSSSSRPSHTRSKSVPRRPERPIEQEPEVPYVPQHHPSQASYYGSQNPQSAPPHQHGFAQPSHGWPRQGHAKHHPAIIYAPSHHAQRPHYAPPAMFHHPPQMGPNGMIYSHSAPPVPGQYPPAYPAPYPSTGSHRHASSHDMRTSDNRDHMRSLGRSTRHPAESAETLGSEKSDSTYYVLPSHGQKVHVINPSPENSIMTATSTTKSPTSPYGPTSNEKKPFFQRIFNFHMFSSAGSSKGSSNGVRRLRRRHSIGYGDEIGR